MSCYRRCQHICTCPPQPPPPLAVTPTSVVVAPGITQQFTASGGAVPYVFEVLAGGVGGTIDPDTGLYTAPLAIGGDTIQVTDAEGTIVTATTSVVNPPIALSPLNPPAIPPGFTRYFTASGGTPPYTWELLPGTANGTLQTDGSPTAMYQAPGNVGQDTVKVSDYFGQAIETTVTVDTVLSLYPARAAMIPNLTLPMGALGGTPPYRYAVASGPGYIDHDTGLYTSSNEMGVAEIEVLDTFDTRAVSLVQVMSPLQIMCEIIQREMELPDGRVFLWDQKVNSPTDPGLYITVGLFPNAKVIGNFREEIDAGAFGLQERVSTVFNGRVSVEIMSRDSSALDRKEEIMLALKSTYSQQQQEFNAMRIFNVPSSFVNISQIDGAAIPYRFSIMLGLQYVVSRTKVIPYFDSFQDPQILIDR